MNEELGEFEDVGIIYVAKNNTKNMVYVGQTIKGIEHRKYQYLISKIENFFDQQLKEEKDDDWEWVVVEENIKKSKLDEREIFYVSKYDSYLNGYNRTIGGNSPCIIAKKIVLIGKEGDFIVGTADQLSETLGCSKQMISQITRMKYRKAKGYKFHSFFLKTRTKTKLCFYFISLVYIKQTKNGIF